MNSSAKIIEPLAKFHARLDVNGRILIPKYIRDTYKIMSGDYVHVVIRIISIDPQNRKVYVYTQFQFSGKINKRGLLVVPKKFRDQLELQPGDLIEVLLMDVHKPDEENISTSYTYVFL